MELEQVQRVVGLLGHHEALGDGNLSNDAVAVAEHGVLGPGWVVNDSGEPPQQQGRCQERRARHVQKHSEALEH